MKSVKRGLWTAAWGCWVWLGFGLYHHLPRTFGPPVCTVSEPKSAAGFIGDTNEVVVLTPSQSPAGKAIGLVEVKDAETGKTLRSIKLHEAIAFRFFDLSKQTARGVWFLTDPFSRKGDGEAVSILDLRTLERRQVTGRRASAIRLHPTTPWAAFVELPPNVKTEGVTASVLDWQTGKKTFVRRFPLSAGFDCQPFFIDGDRLGLAASGSFASDKTRKGGRVEVWKLGEQPVLEREYANFPAGISQFCSGTGRVLVTEVAAGLPFDVYDLKEGRSTLSQPPASERLVPPGSVTVLITSIISRDGRGALAGDPPTLWNVETGKPILKPSSYEELSQQESQDSFFVRELWYKLWESMFPSTPKFRTIAYRRVSDGTLLYRTTPAVHIWSWNVNAKGDLVAANDGNVYRLPLPVDWPLLALCQAVLALPLILFWAILRWRRNRRLRLAGVQP